MPSKPGRVITFYSFKGGTGRTMALANLATSISRRNGGRRLLLVDWDLEAPGLHRYFRPYFKFESQDARDQEIERHIGLIEFLAAARELAYTLPGQADRNILLDQVFEKLDFTPYLMDTELRGLSVLKAGKFDKSYSGRIAEFNWVELFDRQPEFFGALADYWAARYDFVMIDSRTGHTDISGICTCLMPDTLLTVFTPNRQSLEGAVKMVRQAADYRVNSNDLRPLRVLPLVSRVEYNEKILNDSWRRGDRKEDIPGYQPAFEQLVKDIYKLDECDLTGYFNSAQIQYVPYYSFGERIAVVDDDATKGLLGWKYKVFSEIVLSPDLPWESDWGSLDAPPTTADRVWDAEWFAGRRAHAQFIRHPLLPGAPATHPYREVCASPMDQGRAYSRISLRDAWNAVPTLTPRAQAKASDDGIEAEFVLPGRDDREYYSMRQNSDWYSTRPLMVPRGHRHISTGPLFLGIAEDLMNCCWAYESLGMDTDTLIRFRVRHFGLKSWPLRILVYGYEEDRVSTVDAAEAEVEVALGQAWDRLESLVGTLASPVVELFQFTTIAESRLADSIAWFQRKDPGV